VRDDELRHFVRKTVEKAIQPLAAPEKGLGSSIVAGSP
jgi:hypothetical protein